MKEGKENRKGVVRLFIIVRHSINRGIFAMEFANAYY